MIKFKEQEGKLLLYKDGELVSEIVDPTFLWDTETNCILQIGDKANVLNYYKTAMEVCKKNEVTLYYYWVVRELPKDIEILNRLLQHPEELKHFEKAHEDIA